MIFFSFIEYHKLIEKFLVFVDALLCVDIIA